MVSVSILLNGAKGRMGQAICSVAPEENVVITALVDRGDDPKAFIDKCDVIIDFSVHSETLPLVTMASHHKKPIVIGTTGHSEEARERIIPFSRNIPIVWTGNYSIGINLLNYLIGKAAQVLPLDYDIEIVDKHHRYKKDSPSGTAELLSTTLREMRDLSKEKMCYGRKGIVGERAEGEIGVHALRAGDIVGEHTVFFASDGERLELTHRASDRCIFARGAIHAAHWVIDKDPGLYSMQDVLKLG